MWTARSEHLNHGRVIKIVIEVDAAPVSYAATLEHWRTEHAFRAFFSDLLAKAPFAAFRWETPAVTASTVDRPFEFVLLDSPELARKPDAAAFAEHFTEDKDVIDFANLGKDAIMVVPCPRRPHSAYGHLAAFVRHAPDSQKHALWETVSAAMQRRLGVKPVWLSTAGAGVSWLHVRLDDRPKYYAHAPYRVFAQK